MKKIALIMSVAILCCVVSESWAAQPNEVVVTCSGSTGYRRTYDETGSYVVLEEKFSSCNNSTKEVSGKTQEVLTTKKNGVTTTETYTGCTEQMCSDLSSRSSGGITTKYNCSNGTCIAVSATQSGNPTIKYNCNNGRCTPSSGYNFTYGNCGLGCNSIGTWYNCSANSCYLNEVYLFLNDSYDETGDGGYDLCNGEADCRNKYPNGAYGSPRTVGVSQFTSSSVTRNNVTCPEGCSTCNSEGICVVSAPVLPTGCAEISGSKCSKAKLGYFINASGSAEQCASGCNTCSSAEVCTECVEPMFLQEGVCVAQCDTSVYYTNGSNCDELPEGCAQVTNDENHTCFQCKDTYLTKEDGGCVTADECNNGYHISGTSCAINPEGCNTYSDGNCSECNDGYLSNSAGLCTKTEECNGTNFVDSEAKACKPIPGCNSFADGACSCDKGYYKKDGGCVSESAGCGNGYLGKDGECISSANGCGAGYKDMGGYCNRVRYTPAEAAPLLNDNDNFVILTFKK